MRNRSAFFGTVAIFAVVLIVVFHIKSHDDAGRFVSSVRALAQFPLWFLLANACIGVGTQEGTRKTWRAAVLCVVLAALVPVLSTRIAPMRESGLAWDDLYAWSGCLLALLRYTGRHAYRRPVRRTSRYAGKVLILAVLVPTIVYGIDHARMHASFPNLASFESQMEVTRWSTKGCEVTRLEEHSTDGSYAIRVKVGNTTKQYPGIFLRGAPKDWTGFDRLSMDIFAPSAPTTPLWIRVDDRHGNPPYDERGQVAVSLAGGAQTISIPLDELTTTPITNRLDLAHIVNVGIFWQNQALERMGMYWQLQGGPQVLYIDHVRLEHD